MQKVYIVMVCEPYEGGRVLGGFDNEEAAKNMTVDFNTRSDYEVNYVHKTTVMKEWSL